MTAHTLEHSFLDNDQLARAQALAAAAFIELPNMDAYDIIEFADYIVGQPEEADPLQPYFDQLACYAHASQLALGDLDDDIFADDDPEDVANAFADFVLDAMVAGEPIYAITGSDLEALPQGAQLRDSGYGPYREYSSVGTWERGPFGIVADPTAERKLRAGNYWGENPSAAHATYASAARNYGPFEVINPEILLDGGR